ncbi:hypothetical protein DYBT9275_04380 [Dyadobacter sp. CECT 9275]|uniref:SGNH hydrolase-type esterase domain-containing protein n=1 Tax=Dyadobacter helix TaxID=2822344 RepID=A0A916JEB4_9BACT|nr:SGNH/GDSL hydrolase family protein [Dyadobacter sp. CECT 9275]CAG5008898.1 hypothetical protein DYBT9275_04380 [Dyadobacter sp. CECT 9275]
MLLVAGKRYRRLWLWGGIFLPFLVSCKVSSTHQLQEKKPRVIAFFGSSVCRGSGDEEKLGYAGRFARRLDTLRWKYVNVSIGGDNTIRLQQRIRKDLYPQHPDYVVIGLSLSNEGIVQPTDAERHRILERFRAGLLRMADSVRVMGAVPVFTNCYPRNSFSEEYYQITRQMNGIINEWPVPSINLLGTVDDGTGKWVKGFEYNGGHPNALGYEEMSRAVVPTLFDALEAKKPVPYRNWTSDHTRFFNIRNTTPVLQVTTDTLIRSFSESFMFQVAGEGVIAAVMHRSGVSVIKWEGGKVIYQSGSLSTHLSVPEVTRGQWVYLTLAHRHAAGETFLYINGKESNPVKERLKPNAFLLGGFPGNPAGVPDSLSFKDWMIHRSALNASEASDYMKWKMLRSSLEMYAPLSEIITTPVTELRNEAQSFTRVLLGKDAKFQVVRLGMQKDL